MGKAKPFDIPKRVVWEAYQRVRANRGAAGVDDQSIEAFDRAVKNNLFKLWNRLSSGSYFPPPVKRVAIKKRQGGSRPLGIPTVSDRIAQGVVKAYLEPELEGHFHPNSYGYRPGKSALEAVGIARQRCWRHDWVLDLDIQAFFDTIPHDLLLRAVRKHTEALKLLKRIMKKYGAPRSIVTDGLRAYSAAMNEIGVAAERHEVGGRLNNRARRGAGKERPDLLRAEAHALLLPRDLEGA